MQVLQHGDPRSIGRFRILARVGSGGMAIVYFARSAGGRPVAVKMMHAEFVDDQEHRDRFHLEVTVTRAVGGPYCPGVLDADPSASRPWMATEFLPAVSLREAIRRFGPLPVESVWPLAAGLAEALTSIHRAGFVHLDLKPANVLLTADGPRVIDFGIAGALRTGGPVSPGLGGTRGFMSPEQAAGASTGSASDVFSLGSTLAYACTGAPPAADSPQIADGDLRTLIAGCLHPDPAARPGLAELAVPSLEARRDRRPAWPPPLAAEIDRRIAEADNPPVAVPERQDDETATVRRRVLLYGAGALIAGLGVSVLLLDNGGSGPPPSQAAPRSNRPSQPALATSSAAASSAVATAVPRTRVLEFYLTGDATLTSLTYTVNGQTRRLKNVKLPWRSAIDIPDYPPSSTWRIRYRHRMGNVTYRVMVDKIMAGYGGGRDPSGNGGGNGTA